ncbi:MAG: hypothetical protein JWM87_3617 [Candidatus Eremiobacteraeota bacterium]|nr:hypothetical protein [Candidatus Eremiobacteraeota bacterium]
MKIRLVFALDALAVVLAWIATSAPLPRGWIEHGYANGMFAAMNRAFVPLTDRVPFAIGDLQLIAVLAALVAWWVRALRRAPRGSKRMTLLALVAHTAAFAALGVVLFELVWGLNYRRVTVVARVDYSEARVTDAAVARFSERIVDTLNANVAAAHAESLDRAKLRAAFEPLVRRLGDRWDVAVTVPKTTLLDPYYEAAGIGGQYSPFAFETLLNASFLPIEVPRALAHEWAHVGGFTNEGDANYIGTLACLRSDDPLIRYSGAFWTYGDLPESERRRLHLDPRVVADFQASRERFLRHYQPRIFALQWNVYDRFLRSNGVAGGVASYGFFLKLLVGTPLDADGLPLVRATRARA